MKTAAVFRQVMVAAFAAAALASCSRDVLTEEVPRDVYTFTLDDAGTRAILARDGRGAFGQWESGDRLGTVVENDAPAYSTVTPGSPSTFNIYRSGGIHTGERLYVYYPYNASTASVHEVCFEIPGSQSQDGDAFDFDAMPLAAAPLVVNDILAASGQVATAGEVHLYNLAAMASFRVLSSNSAYRNEMVRSLRFDAGAAIAGGFTKDISGIVPEDEGSLSISGLGEESVTTTVSSPQPVGSDVSSAFCVYMVLAPGNYAGTLTVVTDKARYTFTASAPRTFRRSVILSMNLDLAAAERLPLTYLGCYEMPRLVPTAHASGQETFGSTKWQSYTLDTDSRMVVTHTYVYNGTLYRNYTAVVDRTRRCPVLTLYPMHGGAYPNKDAGRAKFSTETSYDPAVPSSWQSSGSTADYNNGKGYSRGHHCASEDRQTTSDANWQTFYYTNQSPQIQNGFNGGIWASLEGAVQTKAAGMTGLDTMYVATGTLYEESFGKPLSGPSNDGGTVGRPSHFYKCLMLCRFDSQGNIISASGAAYFFTNEAHSGKYSDAAYRTTIDAIEERSGFDLFCNVPEILQDSAESVFTSLL